MELLQLVVSWAPDRRFMLVGDSAYGGKSVSRHLPENADLTSRMPMNAALYSEPPVRKKGEKDPPAGTWR